MAQVIIIGAGAAGLFAAGVLANAGVETVLVEHSSEPGKKILITGKGRCNVTNNCTQDEFLANLRHGERFMFSSAARWGSGDTMAFFEDLGVPLKTERGARVFPKSDKAEDIRAALLRHAGSARITHGSVKAVTVDEAGAVTGVQLKGGERIGAQKVLLCTGGASYPTTGSTGDGYKIARALGHEIVPPVPSLVPLALGGGAKKECAALMGLSLRNVNLSLLKGDKKVYSEQGEMLFTHFGVSGPLVLSASSHMEADTGYTLSIDLKPALSHEQLYARIGRDFDEFPTRQAKKALEALAPKAMAPIILARWGVQGEVQCNQLSRVQRQQLVEILKGFTLPNPRREGMAHAVVTAGGVSTAQVNPKTMESKKVSGLYFAGEVLDIDGYTGGFNLQVAFATANAAAGAIIDALSA